MQRVRAAGWAVLLLAVAVISSGCQGFAALDQPPVAKFTVSPNPEIDPGLKNPGIRMGEKVVLDASGSSDPQGYELSYQWTLRGGATPPLTRLSSTTDKVVSFYPEAANVLYTVSLTVTARVQSSVSRTRLMESTLPDPNKTVTLIVRADEGGDVDPWGIRVLGATEMVNLRAYPKDGYIFKEWTFIGSSIPEDRKAEATKVNLQPGSSTIVASFAKSRVSPRFLAWKKAYPNGLLKVDGETGLASLVGDGSFSGQMVSLARMPDGVLYGAGSSFSSPVGVQLFVIDPVTGMAGLGVDFQAGKTPTTVSGLAFSATGTLYALEKAPSPRLFKADPKTASLSGGVDLLLNTLPVPLRSLAPSSGANVFFGTDGTTLYKVDPTGALTKVGGFGTASPLTSLTFTKDGGLFAIDEGTSPSSLYSINTTNGTAALLTTLSTGLLALLVEP